MRASSSPSGLPQERSAQQPPPSCHPQHHRSLAQALMQGLRLTVVLWLLSVVVISLPLLGLARLVAPWQAEGSLIARHGVVIGSR